jgi:hypothetical protein
MLLAAAGCSDETPTSASSTTTTTFTTPVTVTFPGVVGPGGSVSRSFSPQLPGRARAAVGDITPSTRLSIALGVPRADGTGCLAAVSSTSGNGATAEVATDVDLGTFCVIVWAPAVTAETVRFTVSLTHP